MGFYTAPHGKFHDRRYSDTFYGISSIDIIGCCTQSHGNYHVLLPMIDEQFFKMMYQLTGEK